MRLAYLINYYPAPSHTFIRREIQGLREQGVDPLLISIRSFLGELPDPHDARERQHTHVVLKWPFLQLSRALLWQAITRPGKTLAVLRHTIRQYRRAGCKWSTTLGYFAEACVVHQLLRRHDIEHLHVHMGTNAAAVAQVVRWLGGPPYSITLHGPEEFDQPAGLCLDEKLRDAQFVVSVSQHRCEQLRTTYRSARDKTHLIRCGVDADFANTTNDSLPTDVPDCAHFVSIGRLCPRKNHSTLIAAVDQLRSSRPDVRLTIVGDGELYLELQEQIRQRQLDRHIQLLGMLNSAEVARHLAAARALVLPSLAETLPCVIMEAFAMHRPVICTDVGSISELVVDGQNGWTIAEPTVDAIVSAMQVALATPVSQLNAMASHGADIVHRMYSAEHQANQLLQLIERSELAAVYSHLRC